MILLLTSCHGLWDGNLYAHKEKCPRLLWRWSPSSTFHTEQPICCLTLSAFHVSAFMGLVQSGFMGALNSTLLWARKTAAVYRKWISIKQFSYAWTQNHLLTGNNTLSPLHGKAALTGLIASRNLHVFLAISRSLEGKVRNSLSLVMGFWARQMVKICSIWPYFLRH